MPVLKHRKDENSPWEVVGVTREEDTPDVSEQIEAHNNNKEAHADIRETVNALDGKMQRKSNPNLLINWYFADPVDQRGGYVVPPGKNIWAQGAVALEDTDSYYTVIGYQGGDNNPQFMYKGEICYSDPNTQVRGYTGVGYGIDRWNKTINTVLVEDDGILLEHSLGNATNSTWQVIPLLEKFRGKPVTFSILTKDYGIVSKTYTIPATGTVSSGTSPIGDVGRIDIYANSNTASAGNFECRIQAFAGKSVKVIAAKLELGSEQTLAHQEKYIDENGVEQIKWVLNDAPPSKELELLKCIQSKADPNDTYANKVIATGHMCNKNLLDNWYFGNPVNQRGQTEYTGAGYTIDRWINWNPSYSNTLINDGSIKIMNGDANGGRCLLGQKFEVAPFVGKTVTFSALVKNVTNGFKCAIYQNGSSITTATSLAGTVGIISIVSITRTIEDLGSIFNCEFHVGSGGSAEILAAKLELGTEQTLAHMENGIWVLNEIPNYAEELAKCQRHQFVIKGMQYCVGRTFTASDTNVSVFVPLPVTLRDNAAVTYASEMIVRNLINGNTVKGTPNPIAYVRDNAVEIQIVIPTGFGTLVPCMTEIFADANTLLILDANIY